jgi:hypothetical protein
MIEVVRISETSVNFYGATRRNIPEGCHFRNRRRENVTSHFSETSDRGKIVTKDI